MLFLSPWMLLGLAGISIPVLIHLVRKQAAKPVDWGAMRFLFDTVAIRRRKMEWEDLLLMAARCLLLALVALAVARPFVPPDSRIPWMFVLPAGLLGVALVAGSFVVSSGKWRWMIRLGGLLLLLGAAGLVWFEEVLNLKRFEATGRRDVALVIDASSSMELRRDGQTVFERAIEEARDLVRDAPRGTAFTVVLGGPAPVAVSATPLTHRADVLGLLDGLKPVGGTFRAHEALGVATLGLADGTNAAKEIVVFTDAQRHGWRLENPGAWESLEGAWEALPTEPKLLLRNLGGPSPFRNLMLGGMEFSREVVGTDRAVAIRVPIENTGSEAVTAGEVILEVDGKKVDGQPVGLLVAGQVETVEFRHRFRQSGPAVVTARMAVDDDLPGDDRVERVAVVRRSLSVLLVDGNPSGDFLDRATGYMALALAPKQMGGGVDGVDLMDPEVIPVSRLKAADLEGRDVVVLADVPRLPAGLAGELSRRVLDGAGLVIVAGPRCEPDFYNAWDGGGGAVVPVPLGDEKVSADGVSPASATFVHESLELFRTRSDLEDGLVRRWRSTGDPVEGAARGASLANGDTWVASRSYGRGRSLLVACALDARSGNLPARRSFVPLVHEWVTWAAGDEVDLNLDSAWSPRVAVGESRGGLRASYVKAKGKQVAVERVDPAIDFDWGDQSPARNLPRDQFSVEWRGRLVAPVTGTYRFEVEVDDDFEMVLGDAGRKRVSLGRHGLGEFKLEAGEPVPFSARYREESGEAFVRLFWIPPGGVRSLVPGTAFLPESSGEMSTLGVVDPQGVPRAAHLEQSGRGSALVIQGAAMPGIYRVDVGELGARWLPDWEGGSLPVAVEASPDESRFEAMTDDDLSLVSGRIDLVRVGSVDDVRAVWEGRGFGRGIWRLLALAGLVLFLLESVLSRWVSRSRRTAEDVHVEFGETTVWGGGHR
ncbi:PA14 domain-containing protein [Haloferula rosea]|uniref:BatA domain-containing protein n=1 Tax=Haloferula rosea TaxID=490093 RepID=A0A934VHD8_9BACT|nr:PA14 domain-containing protein [Haloferula rosea]MBK1828961.1 BatA domain-containing protein [Haloferula rosea]